MDHMSGSDRKWSVIRDVPKEPIGKRWAAARPSTLDLLDPEEKVLVLRTIGLCGLWVESPVASKNASVTQR